MNTADEIIAAKRLIREALDATKLHIPALESIADVVVDDKLDDVIDGLGITGEKLKHAFVILDALAK